jgi:hypothetical protein
MAEKNEILQQIVDFLEKPFAEYGFVYKKKGVFERIEPNMGSKQQYIISLSKAKGYFLLHLILSLENAEMLKEFDALLKEVRINSYAKFPEKFREESIKELRKINYYGLIGLTDWRELKSEDETLEDFNNRFTLWLHTFDELDELNSSKSPTGVLMPSWKEQLMTSIDLCLKFFKKTENINYIIEKAFYQGLFLLKKTGRNEELKKKYNDYIEWRRKYKNNTDEEEYFYKRLMEI